MANTIHTGLIGFGLSGRVFHAPFIHTHPGFELFVVVERHERQSEAIYPYVKTETDYRNLLKNDDLELVVITTPNILHYPMAADCLKAGKHIVIEKPFTPTSAEADALIRLADEAGKHIFVYQNRRWDADFLTIKKLMQTDVLGNIEHYEAHFDRFAPELKPGAWRNENIPGGGILYDLGSHLIDQALVLFGMPEAVRAEVKTERPGSEVDDSFFLELLYPDKKAVLRAGMMVEKPGPRYIIQGNKARYNKPGIDPQEARLKEGMMPSATGFGQEEAALHGSLLSQAGNRQTMTTIPSENGNYMAFYDGVCAAIRENKPGPVLPVEARDVIFIIEKAFESSVQKKTIKINKHK